MRVMFEIEAAFWIYLDFILKGSNEKLPKVVLKEFARQSILAPMLVTSSRGVGCCVEAWRGFFLPFVTDGLLMKKAPSDLTFFRTKHKS